MSAEGSAASPAEPAGGPGPCLTCGACCAYSAEWPRFSTETDEELDRIPSNLVHDSLGRMRAEGDRCAALAGAIGDAVACTIYEVRPHVCRACQPGDEDCLTARARHRLAPLPPF
jgi:hypothetical protein